MDLRRSWIEQVMGLPVSVLARGAQAQSARAAEAVTAVYAELREVDALFSPYRADSEMQRLGRGELKLGAAHPDVQEVAELCARARADTDGLFDADRPDGRWDPSGLVKGWAVERAARHLSAVAVDWCLNAGGDVVLLCPSGEPFRVGIEDPVEPSRLSAVVVCSAGAVATSGTAARGGHLYHPGSGSTVVAAGSVSVCGPSLCAADVLATAVFVGGPDALALVRRQPAYSALRIAPDGRHHATPGWPGHRVAGTGTLPG
ncbi:MAG TPA: FAD:protein FMN transferase [Sporichthyaceae bacterium]